MPRVASVVHAMLVRCVDDKAHYIRVYNFYHSSNWTAIYLSKVFFSSAFALKDYKKIYTNKKNEKKKWKLFPIEFCTQRSIFYYVYVCAVHLLYCSHPRVWQTFFNREKYFLMKLYAYIEYIASFCVCCTIFLYMRCINYYLCWGCCGTYGVVFYKYMQWRLPKRKFQI